MLKFRNLFKNANKHCAVIGMVHVGALPGTPQYRGSVDELVENACKESEMYIKCGINGLLVENMNDLPYIQSKDFGPETTATLARICADIRKIVPKTIPCGIQVLALGNEEALAIAKACDFDFIRAEGFVFSHIADEGFTDANAGKILRYRKSIDAENVLIFTDIKKKHSSHAITNDVSLVETAKAAEFFLSDGLILTGTSTGSPADAQELQNVRKSSNLPVMIGSGVTASNFGEYLSADAVIVGSHFKMGGNWKNELDETRLVKFMDQRNSHFV